MKFFDNVKIPVKLGILVATTLLGLSLAGLQATYLVSQQMHDARMEQVHALVETARNMAIGLQKKVSDEHLAKDAAVKEFIDRARTMTYDKGNGYIFAYDMNGIALVTPDPKQYGTNRLDIPTNGRSLTRELRDGVAAKGEVTLYYEYVKPGSETPIRKFSYAVAVPEWNLFIGTGAYLDDLDAKMKPIIWTLASSIFGIALVSGLIAWLVARSIARPLASLGTRMQSLAQNDLDNAIPGIARRDELGDMARTVEVFKMNGIEVRRMRDEQRKLESFTAAQRKHDMIKLADDFECAVGGIIDTVSSASAELEASATSLTTMADRSQKIAVVVAAASEEASANVQSVAAATEEMSSTVNEISRQVQESTRIATEAVEQARATNARVSELSEAASRIGDVVELITVIAGQTNLLALNATIEAARAGDAGRGFAVVASEVKALAAQTAKATGEISQQIADIQNATGFSVTAIKDIGNTIGKMSEIAAAIAAAVEEQGTATQEIARNVQQAAHGTREVSTNIVDVQRGTLETGLASSQVLSAAQLLSHDSNKLKVEVERFLGVVRTA